MLQLAAIASYLFTTILAMDISPFSCPFVFLGHTTFLRALKMFLFTADIISFWWIARPVIALLNSVLNKT